MIRILSEPIAGWCKITLDNFSAKASYTTDIAIECLQSLVFALKNDQDFCVSFDAENNANFSIISSFENCTSVILYEDEPRIVVHSDMTLYSLAQILYYDIYDNISSWVDWMDGTELDRLNRLTKITNLLIEVRKLAFATR